jgi:hypothetical protein
MSTCPFNIMSQAFRPWPLSSPAPPIYKPTYTISTTKHQNTGASDGTENAAQKLLVEMRYSLGLKRGEDER